MGRINTKWLIKRTFMLIVTIIFALLINFTIPRLSPGDPIGAYLARLSSYGFTIESKRIIEQYKEMFGLDKDIFTQFLCYIKQLLTGDLGYSASNFPAKVEDMIFRSIPWTIFLLGYSVIVSWILGTVTGGILGWIGEKSRLSGILSSIALALYATPYYLLALVLIYAFAYLLKWFPVTGAYSILSLSKMNLSVVMDILYHSTLPALSIIISSMGWWFLSMKSMVIRIKQEDYMVLALAKGLSNKRILWKYAFRNALLPQVTGLALSLGNIFGGALLTEVIFAYPGLGLLLYNAIVSADYPVIQGITLLSIIGIGLATYILDIIYPLIDPRIGRD